ncbi:MAG: hypothetical protein IPM77_15085 [Crocinitomicaceae bacterium]|nr:hypothetical protein [Crocinitomicaceae bacterium]
MTKLQRSEWPTEQNEILFANCFDGMTENISNQEADYRGDANYWRSANLCWTKYKGKISSILPTEIKIDEELIQTDYDVGYSVIQVLNDSILMLADGFGQLACYNYKNKTSVYQLIILGTESVTVLPNGYYAGARSMTNMLNYVVDGHRTVSNLT